MGKFLLALQALDTAIKGVQLLETYLQTARENHEMTPEEEAQYDLHIANRMSQPHWHGRNPES